MAQYTEAGRASRGTPVKLKYAVVYERASANFSAYVPDLPGCISTGETLEDTRKMIAEAIAFHLEGLTELGEPIPSPRMSVGDAMAHHIATLAGADEPVPDTETTFGMVEVQTAPSRAATR